LGCIDIHPGYHACVNPRETSQLVRKIATAAGFDRCGITPAVPIGRAQYLRDWLGAGRAGSMDYMHRYFEQRIDPSLLVHQAKSVIVVALLYHQQNPETCEDRSGSKGRIATYAWGDDYHDVVREKLRVLVNRLRGVLTEPFDARVCVDTAPILERELAERAGVGWIGKNTMAIHPQIGSYFFLGEIVTTLDLAPDEPMDDHCGTCTACLDACPTNAFPVAYEMDASRCISYLTIEQRGEIAPELQRSMGNWVFGCDICQEVCPFNRKAPVATEPRFAVREPAPRAPLREVLEWSMNDYRKKLKGRALKRAKLDMWRRNAEIVRGNAAAQDEPKSES
jgi:epoxyqueuosine reductase